MEWINGMIAFALPPLAVPLAAVPDAWIIGLPIAQLVIAAYQQIYMSRLADGQRKLERTEDARDAQILEHKKELNEANKALLEANSRLVDSKIEAFDHIVGSYKQFVASTSDLLTQQINRHTAKMDELQQTDHKNEVSALKALSELMGKVPTKDDLKDVRDELREEIDRVRPTR